MKWRPVNNLNKPFKYDMVLSVSKEKILGEGEDSYAFCMNERKAMVGVFDGLGGSGARQYERFDNKTGAFVASRAVAGASRDWFEALSSPENDVAALRQCINSALETCGKLINTGKRTSIKSSMSRSFPTTASLAVCRLEQGACLAHYIWAGDSRGYLLTAAGLMQITQDDAEKLDIRESMRSDAPMNNVISYSAPWALHSESFFISTPGIVFTATDGFFDYWRSPMDFEYLLLDTLMCSNSPIEWENSLFAATNKVAGDDFSFCGLVFGFGTFSKLKDDMNSRLKILKKKYIEPMDTLEYEDIVEKWVEYSASYLWENVKQNLAQYSGTALYP